MSSGWTCYYSHFNKQTIFNKRSSVTNYSSMTTDHFFLNINWSTWSGRRTLLCAFTMSPAVLKTRSAGTLVPGMHRYRLARVESTGSSFSWDLHHFMAFSVKVLCHPPCYVLLSLRCCCHVAMTSTIGRLNRVTFNAFIIKRLSAKKKHPYKVWCA